MDTRGGASPPHPLLRPCVHAGKYSTFGTHARNQLVSKVLLFGICISFPLSPELFLANVYLNLQKSNTPTILLPELILSLIYRYGANQFSEPHLP